MGEEPDLDPEVNKDFFENNILQVDSKFFQWLIFLFSVIFVSPISSKWYLLFEKALFKLYSVLTDK